MQRTPASLLFCLTGSAYQSAAVVSPPATQKTLLAHTKHQSEHMHTQPACHIDIWAFVACFLTSLLIDTPIKH